MFELTDVRYIQGAPLEWRRVLTPGKSVVLHFEESGMRVVADNHPFDIPWTDVKALSARGPNVPEQRFDDRLWPMLIRGSVLGALIDMNRPYESYCWLAVIPKDGEDLIFEVEQMLRPELEALLDAHGK